MADGEGAAFPMGRGCGYRMPEGYGAVQRGGPLVRVRLYDGRGAWLVGGYEAGCALLLDERLSSDALHPGFPHLSRLAAQQRELGVELPLVGADGAVHARQRRRVTPAFGIRRVAALRPVVERIAGGLLDGLLARGRTAELVEEFAKPFSFGTALAVFGVPQQDLAPVERLARRMLAPDGEAEGEAAAEAAYAELRAYLTGLVAGGARGEGLIGDLVRAGHTDHDELAMTALVLLGGSESTATTLATAVLALLEHPDQLARLRAGGLSPDAVDELTRLVSAADELPRVALADIEIAGVTIRAGEGVIVSTMLMNRDPAVWAAPETMDLGRRSGRHVAFGYGAHQCVGQNLARAELEIGLGLLFERMPQLRLAVPAAQVPVHPAHAQQSGVSALPVGW